MVAIKRGKGAHGKTVQFYQQAVKEWYPKPQAFAPKHVRGARRIARALGTDAVRIYYWRSAHKCVAPPVEDQLSVYLFFLLFQSDCSCRSCVGQDFASPITVCSLRQLPEY